MLAVTVEVRYQPRQWQFYQENKWQRWPGEGRGGWEGWYFTGHIKKADQIAQVFFFSPPYYKVRERLIRSVLTENRPKWLTSSCSYESNQTSVQTLWTNSIKIHHTSEGTSARWLVRRPVHLHLYWLSMVRQPGTEVSGVTQGKAASSYKKILIH